MINDLLLTRCENFAKSILRKYDFDIDTIRNEYVQNAVSSEIVEDNDETSSIESSSKLTLRDTLIKKALIDWVNNMKLTQPLVEPEKPAENPPAENPPTENPPAENPPSEPPKDDKEIIDYDNLTKTIKNDDGTTTVIKYSDSEMTKVSEQIITDANGNEIKKDVYKSDGKTIDRTYDKNFTMSLDSFMAYLNLDSNKNTILPTEIINAYNQTTNKELKGFLSYFVNINSSGKATTVNEAYKLVASNGSFDYKDEHLANYGIEQHELSQWVSSAGISIQALENLKNETYWYDLAGTKNKNGSTVFNYQDSTINNVPSWFKDCAKSMYNADGSPNLYAFRLLSNGNGVSGWGIYESYSDNSFAKFQIDLQNASESKEKFDKLAYAANLVKRIDNADDTENGCCNIDKILNLYASVKDSNLQADKDIKSLLSTYIQEVDGIAMIKNEYKYKTIYANDLFTGMLNVINYYNTNS